SSGISRLASGARRVPGGEARRIALPSTPRGDRAWHMALWGWNFLRYTAHEPEVGTMRRPHVGTFAVGLMFGAVTAVTLAVAGGMIYTEGKLGCVLALVGAPLALAL